MHVDHMQDFDESRLPGHLPVSHRHHLGWTAAGHLGSAADALAAEMQAYLSPCRAVRADRDLDAGLLPSQYPALSSAAWQLDLRCAIIAPGHCGLVYQPRHQVLLPGKTQS